MKIIRSPRSQSFHISRRVLAAAVSAATVAGARHSARRTVRGGTRCVEPRAHPPDEPHGGADREVLQARRPPGDHPAAQPVPGAARARRQRPARPRDDAWRTPSRRSTASSRRCTRRTCTASGSSTRCRPRCRRPSSAGSRHDPAVRAVVPDSKVTLPAQRPDRRHPRRRSRKAAPVNKTPGICGTAKHPLLAAAGAAHHRAPRGRTTASTGKGVQDRRLPGRPAAQHPRLHPRERPARDLRLPRLHR